MSGKPMTLEQVRDWHLVRVRYLTSDEAAGENYKMAAAIDAHLNIRANAVDIDKVREVIAELREWGDGNALGHFADKLTAALQEKGK